tara:strand:+ start:26 stop:151 length:126 start_codon:yes stop_codon:yes gene_type:complete
MGFEFEIKDSNKFVNVRALMNVKIVKKERSQKINLKVCTNR